MDVIRIKNNKDMVVDGTAVATVEDRIALLSIIGALTAVKAIWASVVSRRSPVYVQERYGYKRCYGDGDVEYLVVKQSPAPGVHHWVLYPEPGPTAPYLLLVPLQEMGSPQEQLVHLLNQHTLWPVRAEWAQTLWDAGCARERGLVRQLKAVGLPWAYAVSTLGWDQVIDQAARDGGLVFG